MTQGHRFTFPRIASSSAEAVSSSFYSKGTKSAIKALFKYPGGNIKEAGPRKVGLSPPQASDPIR